MHQFCRRLSTILLPTVTLALSACTGMPEGTRVVDGFEAERYLGKWYEIARLDHRFERNLDCVTAEYSWREDGGIRVLNSGINLTDQASKAAEGRAYLATEDTTEGRLKVSFFGPFFGGYNILALDDDYQWSLVAGPSHNYLWVLSRTPTLSDEIYQRLLAKADSQGFDTSALIIVKQGEECAEVNN